MSGRWPVPARNIDRLELGGQVELVRTDLFPPGRAPLIVCNPPWVPGKPSSPLEYAIYDPDSRMLRGFLAGLAAHLEAGGEGWLILSDLAEHLKLRSREALLEWIGAAGLKVLRPPRRAPDARQGSRSGRPAARRAGSGDHVLVAAGRRRERLDLPVVPARQTDQGDDGADQREQHVRLRIPDVALRGQEFIGILADQFRDPPLDQFIERADRQHHAQHQEAQHAPAIDVRAADQDFASHQRRNEPLKKMPDLVVGIALDSQQVGQLETERHACVRVGSADDQHDGYARRCNSRAGWSEENGAKSGS